MKKKEILSFIIEVLVGAIVTTGVFLILKGNSRPKMGDFDKSNFPSRENFNKSVDTEETTESE